MAAKLYRENEFLAQLEQYLRSRFEIQQGKEQGYDMVVFDPSSGKRVLIEVKDAGEYGELPISSILSLLKQKNNLSGQDQIFLITPSGIPGLLHQKLEDIGIKAFVKPSVEDVAGQVQYAMAG
jgi:hypothetical protein